MSTTGTSRDHPATRPLSEAGGHLGAFVTTHWSVVLAATRSDTTRAQAALARLCQAYWYPLYAYVRRRGYEAHDAQDLTQEFFTRLLEQNWLAQADRERGRFRTFLLAALSHFLANEWDKARAKKRGGAVQIVPLQLDSAETRYGQEPADPVTPEQCFERRWALALLEEVLNRLREEHAAADVSVEGIPISLAEPGKRRLGAGGVAAPCGQDDRPMRGDEGAVMSSGFGQG